MQMETVFGDQIDGARDAENECWKQDLIMAKAMLSNHLVKEQTTSTS